MKQTKKPSALSSVSKKGCSFTKTRASKRSQKGGTKENVLYLGAGGGGDTNAAILRAMIDMDDNSNIIPFVMGAGYKFKDAYLKALEDGVEVRGQPGKYDRPSFESVLTDNEKSDDTTKFELLHNYLDSTLENFSGMEGVYKFNIKGIQDTTFEKELFNKLFTRDIYINYLKKKTIEYLEHQSIAPADAITIIMQIGSYEKDSIKTLENILKDEKTAFIHSKLKINVNNDELYLEQSSSFKYRSLLDERIAIRYFSEHASTKDRFNKLQDNLYMFASTDNVDDISDVVLAYDALKTFITQNNINRIVLMDFGGDIFDYDKMARDTTVLMMLLHMMQKVINNLSVDIEIYGPGCDAHETVKKTLENMNKVGIALQESNRDDKTLTSMIEILNNNKTELKKYAILGAGRATGNFLHATELLKEGKSFADMDSWLWKRDDSKKAFTDMGLVNVDKISSFKEAYTKVQDTIGSIEDSDKKEAAENKLNNSKFKLLYDQLYENDEQDLNLKNMANLFKATINNNKIGDVWESLEKNTKSFKEAGKMLNDVVQAMKNPNYVPQYEQKNYVTYNFQQRYDTLSKIPNWLAAVDDFEKYKTLGNTKVLKLPYIPILLDHKKQSPFSLIAEDLTRDQNKKSKMLVQAYNKEVKDDKINSYVEINLESNPSLSCHYTPPKEKEDENYIDWYLNFLKEHGQGKKYPAFYKKYNDFVLIINNKLPMRLWTNKQTEAGMGLVHLLALPTERKYNVMSLAGGKDALMLKDMKNAVDSLFKHQANRKGIIKVIINQLITHLKLKDDNENVLKSYLYKQLSLTKGNTSVNAQGIAPRNASVNAPVNAPGNTPKQQTITLPNGLPLGFHDFIEKAKLFINNNVTFKFFFHGHPDHSVGYLHMHCVSSDVIEKTITKGNSTPTFKIREHVLRTSNLHDHKNIEVTEDAVINFIKMKKLQTDKKGAISSNIGGKIVKKKIGLENLSVVELVERAKAKGVVNARQYKKDQLVAILRGTMKVARKAKTKTRACK